MCPNLSSPPLSSAPCPSHCCLQSLAYSRPRALRGEQIPLLSRGPTRVWRFARCGLLGLLRSPEGWSGAGQSQAHLGHAGLQERVLDQLPVGFVVGEQLPQAGEETGLLQAEAAVSRCADAEVADFGLGPDWEGAEMEAVSRPSTTTTRRLPPPFGESRWPEPCGGGGSVGSYRQRSRQGAERCW